MDSKMYQGFKKAMMKTHSEIYIYLITEEMKQKMKNGNETKKQEWQKSKMKLNMLINTYSRQRYIVMQKKCN